MLFLLGGIVLLGGFLLLVYLFVNADPVRLARNLKWTGIAVAAIALIALLLFPRPANWRDYSFRSLCRCRCWLDSAGCSTVFARRAAAKARRSRPTSCA